MSEKPSSHFEELKQEVGSLDLSHIQRVLDFINGIEEGKLDKNCDSTINGEDFIFIEKREFIKQVKENVRVQLYHRGPFGRVRKNRGVFRPKYGTQQQIKDEYECHDVEVKNVDLEKFIYDCEILGFSNIKQIIRTEGLNITEFKEILEEAKKKREQIEKETSSELQEGKTVRDFLSEYDYLLDLVDNEKDEGFVYTLLEHKDQIPLALGEISKLRRDFSNNHLLENEERILITLNNRLQSASSSSTSASSSPTTPLPEAPAVLRGYVPPDNTTPSASSSPTSASSSPTTPLPETPVPLSATSNSGEVLTDTNDTQNNPEEEENNNYLVRLGLWGGLGGLLLGHILLYRNRKSFYENYWKPQIGLDKKIKSILDKNALDKKFEKIKDFKEDSRRRITELDGEIEELSGKEETLENIRRMERERIKEDLDLMESYEKKQEKINKKSEARRKKMIERKAKELNEIKKKIQVKEESLKTNPDYEMEIRQELAEFKEQETKLTRELDELKKINTNDNTLRIRDDVDIGDGIANEESFNRYMNQKFRKEFAIHLSLEEEASWDSIERKIDENFELIKRNIGGVKVEESLKTEILRKIDEHKNLIKKAIEDFRNGRITEEELLNIYNESVSGIDKIIEEAEKKLLKKKVKKNKNGEEKVRKYRRTKSTEETNKRLDTEVKTESARLVESPEPKVEKTEIPLTEEQEMARDIEGVFGGIAEGISQSGKNKVNEYAERIMNGEILEGVGDAIRNSVRQEVERKELETKARGIVKVRIMDNSNPIVQDYERYIKKIRELEESISIRDKEGDIEGVEAKEKELQEYIEKNKHIMDKYSEALENSSVVEVENGTKTQLKTETQIRNEKNYELDNESGEFGLEWKKPLEEIKIESFDDFKRFMDKVGGLKNKVVNTRKAEFEKLVKEKINLYLEGNFSSLRNLGKIKKIFGLIIDGIKGFEGREVEKFGKDLKEVKQIFDRNDIGKQLGRLREFGLEVVRLENGGIRVDAIKLKLPVK